MFIGLRIFRSGGSVSEVPRVENSFNDNCNQCEVLKNLKIVKAVQESIAMSCAFQISNRGIMVAWMMWHANFHGMNCMACVWVGSGEHAITFLAVCVHNDINILQGCHGMNPWFKFVKPITIWRKFQPNKTQQCEWVRWFQKKQPRLHAHVIVSRRACVFESEYYIGSIFSSPSLNQIWIWIYESQIEKTT